MVSVLLNVEVDCINILSPVTFVLLVAIQVYVAATVLVNGILTVLPLQIVTDDALVIVGAASTVTVTVCEVPVQLPAVEIGKTV